MCSVCPKRKLLGMPSDRATWKEAPRGRDGPPRVRALELAGRDFWVTVMGVLEKGR